MGTMGSVRVCLLGLFSGKEVIPHTFHVHWLAGLTRALEGPVMQDLSGEGMLGPIGVNRRSSRMSSRGLC